LRETDSDDRATATLPPADPTDAEIIAWSAADPNRFAEIFDRHAREILRYVHARLGPDLAEDVVADTFLTAFRKRHQYDRTRPSAGPWLYGIATREIARHRRGEVRRQRALARSWAVGDGVAATGEFAQQAADRVAAERLRPQLAATLAALAPAERDLLLLIAWAGLTYEQTAQALGLPVGTVRSRLSRLRAKIRSMPGAATLRLGEEVDDG
jgi:RNA polymerase sigma factor (sigma-70 family)